MVSVKNMTRIKSKKMVVMMGPEKRVQIKLISTKNDKPVQVIGLLIGKCVVQIGTRRWSYLH